MSMCVNFIWRQQLIWHRSQNKSWLVATEGCWLWTHTQYTIASTTLLLYSFRSLNVRGIRTYFPFCWSTANSLFPVLNRGFVLLVLKHVSNPRTADHSIYQDSFFFCFLQRDVTMSHFWMEFSNALRYKSSPTPWSPLTLNYDKRKVTEFSLKRPSCHEGKPNFSAEFKEPWAVDYYYY